MALVDEGLEKEEREELAKTLHATTKPVKPRQGKPVFPYLDFRLDPEPSPPSLASLVTPDTWAIFNRLGLRGSNDWLLAPSSLWSHFPEYLSLECFVKNVSVVNDIAERGCNLMTKFVNRVKSEEARQALVLCVDHHRKAVTSTRKNNLEKC